MVAWVALAVVAAPRQSSSMGFRSRAYQSDLLLALRKPRALAPHLHQPVVTVAVTAVVLAVVTCVGPAE